jgi:glycosyltransferase involved in cell wall biosynthesis
MRVLFVIDHFGHHAIRDQLFLLGKGLVARGHRGEFLTYHPDRENLAPEVEAAGLTIHAHRRRGRLPLDLVNRVRQLSRSCDVVVSFVDPASLYAELGRLTSRSARLVVGEWSTEVSGLRTRLRLQAHRVADRVVVNSHHHRERLAQHFPWMSERLCTIHNGIDLQRWCPGPSRVERAERVKLAAMGVVRPVKNALNLARALALCRDRFGDAPDVLWAGEPDGRDHVDEVDAALRAAGLENRWHWLGTPPNYPALLQSCDALIHPSRFEGFPSAIGEALAVGLPVLASRVCDHPRLVEEGRTGFLFDPESADEIAEAIHRFIELTPTDRAQMGSSARAFAEESLSVDVFVDRFERLLLDVAGERSADRSA